MLSRQLLSRGITSIRPSRLPVHAIPRNLHIQRHLLGARAYVQDASNLERTAENAQSTSDTKILNKKRLNGVAEASTTTGQPQSSHGYDSPAAVPQSSRSFASDLQQARSEQARQIRGKTTKTPEEIEARRRRNLDAKILKYQQKKAEEMPCPEGMAAEKFAAMTIDERIQLRLDMKKPLTPKQAKDQVAWIKRKGKHAAEKKAAEKQTAEKKAREMQCPEGMNTKDFAAMTVEERMALFVHKGGPTRKKKISLTSEEAEELKIVSKAKRKQALEEKAAKMTPPEGVLAQDFTTMTIEEKVDLLPKPRQNRRDAGIKKNHKPTLVSKKKKVKTVSTRAVQYQNEVVNALREAGVVGDGNDLDFAKGGIFSSADTSRMNIMSRGLCDDVLERLGPSLEKHKGCDLIDINPGVGVWSSKLHDFLKPRNHIMMEPDKIYGGQLEKLVEQDPTYKLLPLSGIIWQNLLKLEEEKLLPHQTWRKLGDPELDKPNDTLLITLNLGYYPRRSYLGFASITHLVIHQLFTATRAHSVFQAYGQVRMLVWVHDYEKRIIVPRTLSLRRKSAIESETCSEYVREVCGADGSTEVSQRGRVVNLISAKRVRKKMEEAGISTPPHRMSRLEADMREVMDLEGEEVDRSHDRSWFGDLAMLQKGLADKKYPFFNDPVNGPVFIENPVELTTKESPRVPKGMLKHLSEPYMKWLELKRRVVSEGNQEKKIQQQSSAYDALEAQWLAVSKSDLPEGEKSQQLQNIEEQIETWFQEVNKQIEFRRRRIIQNITERQAVGLEPPLLEWDRRQYEPLVTKPEEFWPRQEMALLDIKPKTLWPSLTKNALGDYDYYDMLLSCLCHYPNKSIVERLASFAPGADEWIIPRCPSLRDVEKGGVINLDMLTVRNMTTEMLREVFEAFMNWPFRPSKGRMLQMMGSTSVHEEDMEENGQGLQSW